ncbi:MAG: hypothetical protein ACO1OB_02440 [Archangium sp.]
MLAREWTFDPDAFDFALLEDELVTAMKRVLSRMPGINAFALYTDESAMTIGAAAHRFESFDDETLWWPPEWSLRDDGTDFDVPYRLILSQHRDMLTRVPFETFHEGFSAALVNAMKRIEFGAVVALRSVNDTGEVTFIGPESMRERFNAATGL